MPRPSRRNEQRQALMPVIARAFAEVGYRRATTALLARRCHVRENVLYRLWPDKRSMFASAIEHVYESSAATWQRLPKARNESRTDAERLLAFEVRHHGEFGLYRILFAGLSETDDPIIRRALRRTYLQFARLLSEQIRTHRAKRRRKSAVSADLSTWAVVGLGTVANIGLEVGLFSHSTRRRLLRDVGRAILE